MATKLKRNIHLLLIDPQNDFADPKGSLYVTGSETDMDRVAHLVERIGHKLSEISVTLDSHHLIHIANPDFWKNSKGDSPPPFTQITAADVIAGKWFTAQAGMAARALKYLEALEKNHRYGHTIWPPHCLIGEWGHGVQPKVAGMLRKWCKEQFATVDFVTKGSNPFTEHFSAVQAEVPDPQDPTSQLNTNLIDRLEKADDVLITGIAGSHCVANTVTDIANNFKNDAYISKFVLLTDTISPVPMCEKLQENFINNMTARGMRTSTSDKYLI